MCYKNLLVKYGLGLLSQKECSTIENHLQVCNVCQEEWGKLKEIYKVLSVSFPEGVSDGQYDTIINKIEFSKLLQK